MRLQHLTASPRIDHILRRLFLAWEECSPAAKILRVYILKAVFQSAFLVAVTPRRSPLAGVPGSPPATLQAFVIMSMPLLKPLVAYQQPRCSLERVICECIGYLNCTKF